VIPCSLAARDENSNATRSRIKECKPSRTHAPANPTSLAFEFRPANLAYYARGKKRLPDTSQGLHHPDRRLRDTATGDGPFAQHLAQHEIRETFCMQQGEA
jgi:hypothetical protein